MEYLTEIIIILINAIVTAVFCYMNMSSIRKQRKRLIAGIILLVALLIFDATVIAYIVFAGRVDDVVIFAAFIPLIIYLLGDAIKDLWKISR